MLNTLSRTAFGVAVIALSLLARADSHEDSRDRVVFYQYALYLLPGSEGDPLATASQLIERRFDQFAIVDKWDDPPSQPTLSLSLIDDAQRSYAPPDLESISYFGRGLSRAQALAVQKADQALLVNFAYPAQMTAAEFPNALALMHAVAGEHDCLIWDEATREIFHRDAWREMRIETWNDGVPSVEDHTVIHAYKNGEYVRAITLGMEKFGLPDIVVNDFSWSSNTRVGTLINLVGQTLIEGGELSDQLTLELDLERIKHIETRDKVLASLLDNAERQMTLHFKPADRDEGDPRNFLLEIRFDTAAGETTQEQQDALLSALFGWTDSIVEVAHNDAILAASNRAKAQMSRLREDFNAGLEPGEYIHVKAPFRTSVGGSEYMWVEVIEWQGSKIRGLLQNEPFNVPELTAGSEVRVEQADLFDYIRYFADGRIEGNETGKLIQQSQQ
ncbi:MAG: DUF2314 domain-containing protein [Pseudomonadota bacterium]